MANKLVVEQRITLQTGIEASFNLPSGRTMFIIQANGGDVKFKTTSASTEYYTIFNGGSVGTDKIGSDQTFYFLGVTGVFVEILTMQEYKLY